MTVTTIATELKKLKNVLIISHNRPDGDTVGSATALKLALNLLGINADLCCESVIPEKYFFVTGANAYKLTDYYVNNVSSYDAVIGVDCSTEVMYSNAYSVFNKGKKKFNIDHHISNSRYADFNYVENTASCCEIIYKLIVALGVEITKDIANCLMLGIVTDTGNFAHSSVTSETLEISSTAIVYI